MKLKFKLLSAAVGVAACAALTVVANAYLDMGDASSYYVSSGIPNDDNHSKKFAWMLQQDSNVNFYYKIAGGGTVSFTLKKWEFWSDPIVGSWYYQTESDDYDFYAKADDYYVEVNHNKGNATYGYTIFSKIR